ncbi:MAG: sigma-54-dependent Fis family transcriptional regulator [Myxococcota bacterium]
METTTQLEALRERLARCGNLDEVLEVLEQDLPSVLPARDRVSLAFLDPDGEKMRVYRVLPPVTDRPDELPRVRVDGTVVGLVARDGVPRVVGDVRADRNIRFGHASHDGIRSTASVPVREGARVVGVMNVGSHVVGGCTEAMLDELAEIAAVVGPAILDRERPATAPRLEVAAPAPELVGRSEVFRTLMAAARRAAASDATVLITGETGVGKTALARAIHRWSTRGEGPFVAVHLADLPPTLVESELFGHERGAFTGAAARRTGRFELAHGGSIFLDEIGESPLSLQSKLLRVLQDGCFELVGGSSTVAANVRVIAATNRDLHEAVARGQFREDLFYRLNVIPLHVPPLRERREDLEPLVDAILARLATRERPARRIAPEGWARLHAHPWRGNVRELESVLRRAVVLEDAEELVLSGFPDRPFANPPPPPVTTEISDWPTRDENERRYIQRVLQHTAGVIEGARGAAKVLGMRPSTLRSRMKRLGVSADGVRREGRS